MTLPSLSSMSTCVTLFSCMGQTLSLILFNLLGEKTGKGFYADANLKAHHAARAVSFMNLCAGFQVRRSPTPSWPTSLISTVALFLARVKRELEEPSPSSSPPLSHKIVVDVECAWSGMS